MEVIFEGSDFWFLALLELKKFACPPIMAPEYGGSSHISGRGARIIRREIHPRGHLGGMSVVLLISEILSLMGDVVLLQEEEVGFHIF